jgi:hypothetical protein
MVLSLVTTIIYMISQEEKSILWEVIVLVILSKKECVDVSYSEWLLR